MTTASLRQRSLTCSALLAAGLVAAAAPAGAATFSEDFSFTGPEPQALPAAFTPVIQDGDPVFERVTENGSQVGRIAEGPNDANSNENVDSPADTGIAFVNAFTASAGAAFTQSTAIGTEVSREIYGGLISRFNESDPDTFYGVRVGAGTGDDDGGIDLFKVVDGVFTILNSNYDSAIRLPGNNQGFETVTLDTAASVGGSTMLTATADGFTLTATDSEAALQDAGRGGLYAQLRDTDDNNKIAYFDTYSAQFEPDVIPEPASLALLGLGSLLIAGRRRRG